MKTLILSFVLAAVPLSGALAQAPVASGRPSAAEDSAERQATAALNGKVIAELIAQRTNAAAAQAQYKGAVAVNRAVALDLQRLENETDDAYAARLAVWRAQVAACEGGDKGACLPGK